jgi:bidirectional [NiFe] hydrogenase diaphorase subunit
MVSLTIDGRRIRAHQDDTILSAAQAGGIDIPALCHHPALEPYAACRLCMVEVLEKSGSRLVTSCNTQVASGMKVRTRSRRALAARRMNLELLLSRAPRAAVLRSLAARYHVSGSRFPAESPEEDCILCGLCVRICEQVVGASAICFAGRGSQRHLTTPFEVISDACIACGACTYVCPTDSVQMESETAEHFRKRHGRLRQCRYSLLGIIPYALCANSFRCATCEVDQRFRDTMETHPAFVARDCRLEAVSAYDRFLHRIREGSA